MSAPDLHDVGPASTSVVTPGDRALRLMVDAVTDYAIFLLDPTGHILTWNRGAQRLKGYTPDEVIGRHFSIFYPEEEQRRGHPDDELRQAVEKGRYEEEGWRLRKDGSRFWANVVITALFDDDGHHVGFTKVTRDFTERRAAEEQLRLSEERFRLLVDSVRDYAIYMLDPEGHVVSWNAGAERLKGYEAEEIVGKHFSIFYPPEARESGHPERELRTALECGRYEEENWRVRKDGTRIWANVVLTPIRDRDDRLLGFAKVTRDLSERRKLEEEREAAFERLQRSNKDLQEFAMVASHDLQEPLRKIQLFGEQLRTDFAELLPEEGRDYLERMQKAADRGRSLIQGLLAYSRITTRAQPLVPTPLGEIARDVVGDLDARIASVGGNVVVGELPTIEADPLQMRQLFQNLIGNALKFHRAGVAPVVEVSATKLDTRSGGPVRWQIRVSDNGIGFDEKYLDRIFKLFQRLHDRGAYEGSGMGLAICRKIVERHGGTITARSQPGSGTTFVIELPDRQPVAEVKR
jgi:PAS domain S-box-containing protein